MEKVKRILENNLLNDVCPFWASMVDKEYGGFYGACDLEKGINKEAPKGIVYISRILYSYSCLYSKYRNEEYLKLAKVAYDFMIDKFYDKQNGGFYWSVDYKGDVLNNNKHLYGNSFALYGIAAYLIASNDLNAVTYGNEIVEIIAKSMKDFPNNYSEEYSVDFKPLPNKIMYGFDMTPEITTNTLLHLAESLSLFYLANQNETAKKLTIELLDIIFDKGYDHENKNLYQFLNYKMENQLDVYSYGHNLEVSWLFMEIMKFINYDNKKYVNYCVEMCEENFKLAYKNGYVINETVNGVTDYSAIWWVQAESLIAINNVNKINSNPLYEEAMLSITEFVQKHFMNEGSEWHWGINEDLTVQTAHSISEMWKANYHNVRAVLRILEESDGK